MKLKPYKKVAVGGTFDQLHKGHMELLTTAFSLGEVVVIGLTDEQMVTTKTLSVIIEPYRARKKNLEKYLQKKNLFTRARIIRLTDSLGPALTDDTIEAVVVGPRVSDEIIKKIKKVKPVIACKTIFASDGSYLSSTRIRKGRVRCNGAVYALPDFDIILPDRLRNTLKKPLGERVENFAVFRKKRSHLLISVGDASTINLISHDIYPDIIILDGMIQKKKVFTQDQIRKLVGTEYSFIHTTSLAGMITTDLTHSLTRAMNGHISHKNKTVIFIRGEDDLAVLPSVYIAPLLSHVVYGQPPFKGRSAKPGMISMTVTEDTKKKIGKLLQQFTSHH